MYWYDVVDILHIDFMNAGRKPNSASVMPKVSAWMKSSWDRTGQL